MLNTLVSTNPSRNYEIVGELNISTEQEIREKVYQARRAQSSWKEMGLQKRLTYFKKLQQAYKKRSKDVARMISLEIGKPITQAIHDTESDIGNIEYKINVALECLSPVELDNNDFQKNVLYYEPYGVAAVISPWNYPSQNFFISNLQVLISGNTVVFKHSEECPLTGKLLEEIMQEADFPDGVFSEIYGAGDVGRILTDQDIDMIHFTGSTKVGQELYRKAAGKFIPVLLEMGGSSPGIIFKNANIDNACKSVCMERFDNCGQICCALKRLIVHKDIYDEVVNKIKLEIVNWKVGDALDKETRVGPLVAKRQLDLLIEQVNDSKEKGVTVITGGDIVKDLKGAYYQPTILTDVTMDMRVMSEEVFGPVLPVISFGTENEAIKLANNTPYGLSAFVYGGDDTDHFREVAKKIDAGQVSINGSSYFSSNSPFGGYKKSGMGRNDGRLGFYEATQKKVIAEPV